ncbi:MAG: hypothetical protein JNM18_11595 [Planctomycetaceae bacterium]|nr:hypothetical protein [Planctomycetaceae bacterium]
MRKWKQNKRSLQKETGKANVTAGDGALVTKVKDNDKSTWQTRWSVVGAVVTFIAAIAGIWAVSGYTLKDVVTSPQPLHFAIGNVLVNKGEDCAVVFALQHTEDNYPRMLGLPFTITNPSETTAKNVDVLIKCNTPLRLWPHELSKSQFLGKFGGTTRVTGEAEGISTSSWTIERIAPGQSLLLVDAIMWEKDVWKIDTPMTIDISISADDRPSRAQTVKLWSAIAVGPIPDAAIAINKAVKRADRGLLVYFENYTLVKSKKGFDTPFYSFQSMGDIKFTALKTEK